jgi:hypothetical protein
VTPDSLDRVRRFARLLDSAFVVPGTRFRFGLDPLLGLIPGIGDLVSPVLGLLVLAHAMRLRVPRVVQLRMAINVAVDALVGEIPILGDLFDFAWRANDWNLALLERHAAAPTPPTRGDWIVVGLVVAVLGAAILTPLVVLVWLTTKVGWF